MNIVGKKVILRAIDSKDLNLLREMLNNPEMEDRVVGWSFPVSEQSQSNWYSKACADSNNIRLVIDTETNGTIGLTTLHNLDWKNRMASVGIKIASVDLRSKGFGTDSIMALMRYMFDELGFHRLESTVFTDNTPSLNLFKKCGWKIEGIKRECVFKNGKYRDLYIIGILRTDYLRLVKETSYWDY